MGLSLLLLIFTVACSDKDDSQPKGTHTVNVVPVPLGLTRSEGIKLFLSESPFESFDSFVPLTSVDVPEDRKITDPVAVDVSDYVGRSLYFVALRKFLLSDGYYNITNNEGEQSLSDLKLTIEEEKQTYDLSFMVRDPKPSDYTADNAKLTLTVKKGNAAVASKEVYWFGKAYNWSADAKRLIEERYSINQEIVQTSMTETKADGTLVINMPVNESGVTHTNGTTRDENEHVFFVIENGVVQFVTVKVNALELAETLQY